MYIVPVFHSPLKSSSIQQTWLFLERNGNHLIEIESIAAAEAFAQENGLILSAAPYLRGDLIFLPVDPVATALQDFYTWREIVPGSVPLKEAWRSFLWAEEELGVNRYLEEVVIGEPNHTVYSVLESYFESK